MAQPEICVIGSGVVGAAVAAALAEGGANVTVLSRDILGVDTSASSFAWLNALEKTPEGYTLMNMNGMRMHKRYAERHGSAPWYQQGGNLHITYGGQETEKQADAFNTITEFDYAGRWLSAAGVRAIEPDLSAAALEGAHITYYPEEGWISGALLIARLLADVRAAGGIVRSGAEVKGFEWKGGRICGVTLAGGEVMNTDIVVNCAGPAACKIAEMAEQSIPMSNEVGVQLYTAPAAVTLNRVIHTAKLNVRPDGAGRICLHDFSADAGVSQIDGASEQDLTTTARAYRYDMAKAAPLMERLAHLYPATEGLTCEVARIGLRPIPADRRPVLGYMGDSGNFYTAVMHSGVTQCLWVGELLRREILSGSDVAELAPYRPERFTA